MKQSGAADRRIHGTYSDASVGVCYSSPMHILFSIVVRGRSRLYPQHRTPATVCLNCVSAFDKSKRSRARMNDHLFALFGLLCMLNITRCTEHVIRWLQGYHISGGRNQV